MIGVAGATGSVGRLVVAELVRLGAGPLRLGGRRSEELRRIAAPLADAEQVSLELNDPESTARFCCGVDVVVNCAGPSYVILDRLALAAREAHASYVDVSGDEPVYERLQREAPTAFTAVLSAGLLPGLSGLVPRWMAQGLDGVESLTTYIGGLERSSPSSATDMILSMESDHGSSYGLPLAGWRAGRVVPRLLRPIKEMEIPFVPDLVSAYPFFSGESERLASSLRLEKHDFWNVFVGERLITAFSSLRGRDLSGAALDRAVADMTEAARLDLLGREPYYALIFCMEGTKEGGSLSRTTAIRTSDAYRLIASVAALSACAVNEGRIGPGIGFAAEVLEPDWAIERIRRSPAREHREVFFPDIAKDPNAASAI